jgi:hypothetical protein
MSVVDRSYNQPLEIEEHAVMPMAGGLMQYGYQCGMLWGAALAAGAQAYRLLGAGPQAEAEAVLAAQRLVESFRARNKEINCLEITEIEWKPKSQSRLLSQVFKFFIKGGPIACFSMAGRYAPLAFSEINASLDTNKTRSFSSPVSCASVLARKMGASDMHAVMAAGFAGGIGLSGGACGALGAAVWLMHMKDLQDGIHSNEFENPRASEAVEKFLNSSEYRFECSEIVGRRFEHIDDHAAHLRTGGCSEIIEALASI